MQRPQVLDRVLERTATRFLRRIHRITHRMPVRLRTVERQRVMVVAPHPDDEVIGIGGHLALHQRAGSEVLALYVTLDAPASDGTIVRRGEAQRAAELLGFRHRFLEFTDGAVSRNEDALGRAIADAIRDFRPDSIFTPFPGDHHRDHQSSSACTGAAIQRVGFDGEVCCYEVWTTLWPNICADISSVVDLKRQAVACYASQTAYYPYAEAALGLNRYRGLRLQVPYAEALLVSRANDFVGLCRTLAVV
jgi:LmbE family N-acetylglucosaminyl deacetylase